MKNYNIKNGRQQDGSNSQEGPTRAGQAIQATDPMPGQQKTSQRGEARLDGESERRPAKYWQRPKGRARAARPRQTYATKQSRR